MNTNNATYALFIYAFVAFSLIATGFYALNRGFKLILSGKGKSREESTVEFLGIKATVGNIGSLVMVTAFLWGYAAVIALPKYQDPNVTIALSEQAKTMEHMTVELAKTHSNLESVELALAKSKNPNIAVALMENEKTIKNLNAEIEASRLRTEAAEDQVKYLKYALVEPDNSIKMIQTAFKESKPTQAAEHAEEAHRSLDEILKKMGWSSPAPKEKNTDY